MCINTPKQAGLIALNNDGSEYLLVIVVHKWRKWRLIQIYRGTLSYLRLYSQHCALALVVPDDQVLHWLEEFPPFMSKSAILRYLKQTKPELLNNPSHHLTLNPLTDNASHLQYLRCWLLTEETRLAICAPFQAKGFTLSALEPLSCLTDRPLPRYGDQSHCLQRLSPTLLPQALLALKVACRHNWA